MKASRGVTCGFVLGLGLALGGPPAAAQETPRAGSSSDAQAKRDDGRPPKLVRVQVVLARFQGERKLSSLPYTLLATTDGMNVRLRMGVEVPVPVTTFAPPEGRGGIPPPASIQYKNVGTNIDCRVRERGDGLFQVFLDAENSSVYRRVGEGASASMEEAVALDRPMFRTFNVSASPVLRDGQTVQNVTSTDPVTGEVVKIDLTLTVLK